jgi:hypothetical protein
MVRTREGWEIIQIALPMELVTHIRVAAAMRRVTNGEVLNELAQAGLGIQGEPVSEGKAVASPRKEGKGLGTTKAKPGPAQGSRGPADYKGKPWTKERLDQVMSAEGLSGRLMAEKLVSRTGGSANKEQVLRWRNGKEGIPAAYWSQLEKLFGGEA